MQHCMQAARSFLSKWMLYATPQAWHCTSTKTKEYEECNIFVNMLPAYDRAITVDGPIHQASGWGAATPVVFDYDGDGDDDLMILDGENAWPALVVYNNGFCEVPCR